MRVLFRVFKALAILSGAVYLDAMIIAFSRAASSSRPPNPCASDCGPITTLGYVVQISMWATLALVIGALITNALAAPRSVPSDPV